jgi:hypothetical protein
MALAVLLACYVSWLLPELEWNYKLEKIKEKISINKLNYKINKRTNKILT